MVISGTGVIFLKPERGLSEQVVVLVEEDHPGWPSPTAPCPLRQLHSYAGEGGKVLKDQATGWGPSGDPPLAEGSHVILVLLPGVEARSETFRGSDEGTLFSLGF